MGVNTEQTESNDPNQHNKFTGEEHNKVQVKTYRQLDLEELIKIMEQENGEGIIQGDKA
jgi:hypothetical protein